MSDDGEYWFELPLGDGKLLTISTITKATSEQTDCDFCDGWGIA